MKKIAYTFSLICFVFVSCSDDESKLTQCSDSVFTGEATDITTHSAVINGYFSFYGEINDFIGDFDYTELIDSVVIAKENINSFLAITFDIHDDVDVSSAPDSVKFFQNPYDVSFIGAGCRVSEYHDFREGKLILSNKTKIRRYSMKVDGLTSMTKYYYKTVLAFRPVYQVDCPTLNLHYSNTTLGDRYDYYVYGETKEFTTL